MNSIDETMTHRWNDLHAEPRFCPRYPNELVVRWSFRTFPAIDQNRYRVLDLGSGAGRHSMFLAREGLDVTACDFSEAGLREARARSFAENLAIRTALCEADNLPFTSNLFAGVLCYGVLYYLPREKFETAVSELFRVLQPGGQALIVTRTDTDSRFLFSKPDGNGNFRVGQLPSEAPAKTEEGMIMTFLDRSQVDQMFPHAKIERSRYSYSGGKFIDDDWVIFSEKP